MRLWGVCPTRDTGDEGCRWEQGASLHLLPASVCLCVPVMNHHHQAKGVNLRPLCNLGIHFGHRQDVQTCHFPCLRGPWLLLRGTDESQSPPTSTPRLPYLLLLASHALPVGPGVAADPEALDPQAGQGPTTAAKGPIPLWILGI